MQTAPAQQIFDWIGEVTKNRSNNRSFSRFVVYLVVAIHGFPQFSE